ncbi:MAG: aminoglycoside phosphotransferase family protein [Rubrivivax sp.]
MSDSAAEKSIPNEALASAGESRVAWPTHERERAFQRWLEPLVAPHGLQPLALQAASADASFRRYLRLPAARGSRIVMDAPPPLEDTRPFVRIASLLAGAGLRVPEVLAADVEQGFLLLEDLGSQVYLPALQDAARAGGQAADRLMRPALAALLRMQQRVPAHELPLFDARAQQLELDLFPTWCVQREFGQTWTESQTRAWQQVCERLIHSNLSQPQVAVHADWMPRNLMLLGAGDPPGVLDFQDAVCGPMSYDLASLLRDAFISWDEAQELDWAVRWWQMARDAGHPVDGDFGEFWRSLEWSGLQRHLKVLGIFCRLKHRDGKPGYAADLPRFFGYATRVAMRYRPLAPLLALLEPLSGNAVEAGFTF